MNAGRRIVVIDDDESLSFLISEMLTRQGYEVKVAPDGIKGMALVNQLAPELVILDFMLPAGGAPVFHRGLRSTSAGKRKPVLILSAIPEKTIAEKLDMDERTYFLGKPYGREELLSTVQQILQENPV